MKFLHIVSFILLIVGGLNWLVFGLFGWDVGQLFPGGMNGSTAAVVYVLVGLATLVILFTHKHDCKHCMNSGSSMPAA